MIGLGVGRVGSASQGPPASHGSRGLGEVVVVAADSGGAKVFVDARLVALVGKVGEAGLARGVVGLGFRDVVKGG